MEYLADLEDEGLENMAPNNNALTDIKCKAAKAKDKTYAMYDVDGLYLEITPSGGKHWRFSYRFAGKRKRMALGEYPEISLQEARIKRDELRKTVKKGADPCLLRKKAKIETKENVANSFENIAMEWFEKNKSAMAERHAFYVIRRLKANIFPFLGGVTIKDIAPKELLAVIRKIEGRGAQEVARRTLQVVGQVFRYAVATGRAEHDISGDLRGALQPAKKKNYSYFSEKEFQEFLVKFADFKGNALTKLALELLMLTFVRSGELRGARWEEFDFDKREWRIPAERMKMKEQHIVPLSEQAIVVLQRINKLTGYAELLFPCRTNKTKPISDNTLSKAFREQGYQGKATPHGMRATASTILNENGFEPDVIERQLAHCERNKIRASYNHAQYLPERREMMNWWGKYVDELLNVEGKK
jgi:integrase